jgi:SAM-dependent methyltransferase
MTFESPPIPSGQQPQEFDTFASNYDDTLNRGLALTGERKEYYAAGRIKWLQSRLKKLGIASPQSCLDFGCGTGTSAPLLLATLGLEKYCGFDPSANSIEQAKCFHASPKARFTCDLSSMPARSIDLAFCNGVFHHIAPAERPAAFYRIAESLKPGGVFAFWENNPWNPMVHFMMSRVEFDRDALMLWPSAATKQALQAGLHRLNRSFMFIFPSALAFARRLEPALSSLPLGGQYLLLFQKDA